MKLFAPLYDKVLALSGHKHAPKYLAGLSFTESSFFPIPPDVMLIPMSMAKPKSWFYLAMLTTIASVLGGLLGYAIGYWLFDWLQPNMINLGYQEKYELAKSMFDEWGIWIIFIAGFSPIPYKVFTVTAGTLSMALLPFIIASFIGRGARFFLVAGLVATFGPKMEKQILKYIEWLGWAVVILLALIIVFVKIL